MNMVPRKWPHQWLQAGACAAALVMAAHAGAAETVKIGFIDLLSGPFALTGQSSLNQLREVVAQVNAKDGLNKLAERDPERAAVYLNYAAMDPQLTNERCSFWHFRFYPSSEMKMEALTTYLQGRKDVKRVY